VVVVHGIKRLVTAFGHPHPLQRQVFAFVNDSKTVTGIPTLVKLEMEDFDGTQKWVQTVVPDIMNVIGGTAQVVALPMKDFEKVNTVRFVPIPLFLVLTFLNDGNPRSAVDMYQVFFDDFFEKAPQEMQANTEYILDFLTAAAGFDEETEDPDDPLSQLSVLMEEVVLDSIILQWAVIQFGGIKEIVALQDGQFSTTWTIRFKWTTPNPTRKVATANSWCATTTSCIGNYDKHSCSGARSQGIDRGICTSCSGWNPPINFNAEYSDAISCVAESRCKHSKSNQDIHKRIIIGMKMRGDYFSDTFILHQRSQCIARMIKGHISSLTTIFTVNTTRQATSHEGQFASLVADTNIHGSTVIHFILHDGRNTEAMTTLLWKELKHTAIKGTTGRNLRQLLKRLLW